MCKWEPVMFYERCGQDIPCFEVCRSCRIMHGRWIRHYEEIKKTLDIPDPEC